MKRFALFMSLVCILHAPALCAWLDSVPVTVYQPDGRLLQCFATGDEYFNWLHDGQKFTIVRDTSTGYYVYAMSVSGVLVPSPHIGGRADPSSVGLAPGAMPARDKILDRRSSILRDPQPTDVFALAPRTGSINNLVVFIRFSDETEFTDPTLLYDNLFNSTSASSLRSYFWECSYNALSISSTFYPTPSGATVVSYQDSHPRAYFEPYDAVTNPTGYRDPSTREQTLLKDALENIASQVPSGLAIDNDADGNVDNITFIVNGSPTGWSTLLWPHKGILTRWSVYLNGKRALSYNFQIRSATNVGVLCHEMFHSLGAPDLYHYSFDGMDPVRRWDLMGAQNDPPQHMGAYMKMKYGGWIGAIPQITTSGVYSVNGLTSATNNSYRIASPNSTTEHFVVENRHKEGIFESTIPGEGLLVYRIDTSKFGNASGPPDEVYVYRPEGTPSIKGAVQDAAFSSNWGRTSINDTTNPSSFLTDGSPGGLNISEVGSIGSTITFRVSIGSTPHISSISPTEKTAGDPTFTLDVYGEHFLSNSVVRFNNSNRTTAYLSVTHLQTAITSQDVASPGSYSVTVFNPEAGLSNALALIVNGVTPGVGTLAVTVSDAEDWPMVGSSTVDLYNRESQLIGSVTTNASLPAMFHDVPAGTGYRYCVWYDKVPAKYWGEEYWGQKGGISITTGVTTSESFKRNFPYASWIKAYVAASNLEVTGPVAVGTPLRIDLGVNNPSDPGSEDQFAKVHLILDRDMAGGHDFEDSTSYQSFPRGYSDTVSFYYTPVDTGKHRYCEGTVIDRDGVPVVSDGSDWTTLFRAVPAPSMPIAPVLATPANGSTGIAVSSFLTWNAASGAESYRLQVSTHNVFDTLVVDQTSIASTSLTANGLNEGTTYYWKVNGTNASGTGPWSTVWSFTTILGLPSAPVLASPSNGSTDVPTTVVLAWKPVTAAASYHLLLGKDPTFLTTDLEDSMLSAATLAVTNLAKGVAYHWRVRAKNVSGPGPWSAPWHFSTVVPLPSAAMLLAPLHNALVGADSVRLVWMQSSPQVTAYCLDVATDSLFAFRVTDTTVTDTFKMVRSLSNGLTYFWRVCAKNASGWGARGEVRRFNVALNAIGEAGLWPRAVTLEQNYPNPFNPSTTIRYGLPSRSRVVLTVFNTLGQQIAVLQNGEQEGGYHDVRFDGAGFSSGVYFYRLQAGDFVATKRFLLLR